MSPGAVYDPACDVDHDGDVDIFDIQLTAGHWNRNGVWTGGDYWALLGNAGTNPAVNFVGTSDNQPLAVRTNNAERMRVAAGGNVGIGTLGPAAPLHVNQGANDGTDVLVTSPEFARMRMVAEAPSVDVTLSLQARGQSTASWAEIGTLSRHDLRFYTNDAYRMALDTNGNVGVGTMGPAARLHVAGSNDGTDVLVTDGEFARMRMEASDPAERRAAVGPGARQRCGAARRDRHPVQPRRGALHQRQHPDVPARQRRGLPGQRVSVGWMKWISQGDTS